MDIRTFNSCVEGYTLRRETAMNDQLKVGHLVAGKISEAVWGSKEFKKPFKEIKLLQEEDDNEARNKKVLQCLRAKGVIVD